MKNNVNKTIILVLLSSLVIGVNAQIDSTSGSKKLLFIAKLGINILPQSKSNKLTYNPFIKVQVESDFILKEKYLFGLAFWNGMYSPDNIPEDYLPFDLFGTRFNYSNFSFLFGYHRMLNESKNIAINLKGGFSILSFTEAKNWKKKGGIQLFGNYTFDYYQKKTVGLLISPEIEFYFSNYVGVTIAPYVLINYIESKYGLSVNFMFGLMR